MLLFLLTQMHNVALHAETARALHEGDAHVYLAVRDVAKGKEVAEKIQTSGQSKAAIDVLKLELDSLESVRSFAKEFQDTSKTLNLLINNAGEDSLLRHQGSI